MLRRSLPSAFPGPTPPPCKLEPFKFTQWDGCRAISVHLDIMSTNPSGNLEQIWKARDTNQQHLSYWVFPPPTLPNHWHSSEGHEDDRSSPPVLIRSTDSFASNAFLEVEDREIVLRLLTIGPSLLPFGSLAPPLTITLPIRAVSAQNQTATAPQPSSPSLASSNPFLEEYMYEHLDGSEWWGRK